MIEIAPANLEQMPQVKILFEEYARSLDFDLAFQGFEAELTTLPGAYAPPKGCILLAQIEGEAAACIAFRQINETTAEMKRLYVKPAHQGKGLGRKLTQALLEKARAAGYKKIRLDTVPSMEAAIKLYLALGFREIEAYRENPIPGAAFFEKDLSEP